MRENFLNTRRPVFCIQNWGEIVRSKGGTGRAVSWMDWQRLGAFMAGVWPEELPPIMWMEGELDVSSVADRHDALNVGPTQGTVPTCNGERVSVPDAGHVLGSAVPGTEAVGDWLDSRDDTNASSDSWHAVTERIEQRGNTV